MSSTETKTSTLDNLIHTATITLSLLFLAVAQFLITRPDPIIDNLQWANWLNETFYLRLTNTSNVMLGALFLLIGAAVFLWNVRPVTSLPTATAHAPEETWPDTNLLPLRPTFIRLFVALFLLAILFLGVGTGQSEGWLALLGLAALALIALIFHRWEHAAGRSLSLNIDRPDLLIIIALFIISLLINTAYLDQLPARLVGDEGSFWEVARDVSIGAYTPSPFGLGVYTFPVASTIVQGQIMRLFGTDLWGWRFSSVFVSLLTVPLLYLFLRHWLSRRFAAVACLIMTTTPFFLAFARLGYNNSQAIFPTMLTVWLWYQAINRRSYFYGWLAGIAAGLGFYTYSAAQIGIVLILLIGAYFWVRRKISLRGISTLTLIALLSWQLTSMPLSIYTSTLPDNVQNSFKLWESSMANAFYGRDFFPEEELFSTYPPIERGQIELFVQPRIYTIFLIRGIFRSLLAFHTGVLGSAEHFVEAGLAGPPLIALFYGIGLLYALKHWKHPLFGMTLLWWGATWFLLSATNTFPPRHTHIINLIPAVATFTLVGLAVVCETAARWWQTSQNLAVKPQLRRGLVVLALLAILATNGRSYFAPLQERYPETFEQAITFASFQAPSNTLLITIDETDTHHDLAYQTQAGLLPNPYLPLDYIDISASDLSWGTRTPVLVFYTPDIDPTIRSRVEQSLGAAQTTIPFINRTGLTMGFALTNLQIDLQPPQTFLGGIRSAVLSPAGWLLLFLTAAATFTYFYTWQNGRLTLAPLYKTTHSSTTKRLLTATLTIDPAALKDDTTDSQQFEISFRFGWRPRKNNEDSN